MFFCKYDGSEFGPMQRRKGSIMEEYGKVTGVEWCTATSLRRSLAPHIQRNSQMQTRAKAVAQHSAAVDSKYYDRYFFQQPSDKIQFSEYFDGLCVYLQAS